MLQLKDYAPIDIDKVKSVHKNIYNIPNPIWEQGNRLERDLQTINMKEAPETLRTFLLNHLPYCIIEIINKR